MPPTPTTWPPSNFTGIRRTEVDVALAAAIPRRRTDRRHYSSWPVPQGDVALMAARAARAGVMLRRVDALANLRGLVSQAAWRHGNDYDYLKEPATWTGTIRVDGRCPRAQTPGNPIQRHRYQPGRSPALVLTQTPDAKAAEDNAVVVALGHRRR